MAAKKKTAGKKATRKAAAKKAPGVKRSGKKAAAKRPAKRSAQGEVRLVVPPDLRARLTRLAKHMGTPMDQLLVQALREFAETWEDHQRVVDALNEGDDRVQLVVGKE